MDAPAFSTVEISSASRVKSAERIDGAISIMAKTQGVGVCTGGRRLTFWFVPTRFAGVVLLLVVAFVALRFSARLLFRLAERFTLPFRLSFVFPRFRLLALELFAEPVLF